MWFCASAYSVLLLITMPRPRRSNLSQRSRNAIRQRKIASQLSDEERDIAREERRVSMARRRALIRARNPDAEQPDASNARASNTPVQDVENFKHILLKEELEFKRKLYEIQLKLAEKDIILKDLEIKIKKAQLLKTLGDQS